MQRLLLLVEKENYSERRAVTGLHLAALRAGIRPPRIVSRVARTIRTSAALGRQHSGDAGGSCNGVDEHVAGDQQQQAQAHADHAGAHSG